MTLVLTNGLKSVNSGTVMQIGITVSKGQILSYIHGSRWLTRALFTRFLLYLLCSVQFSEYLWMTNRNNFVSLVWLLLYTHCRCGGFLLYLITLSHAALHHNVITHTHTRWDASGWGIGPSHKPLPDNTQHLYASEGFEPEIPANEWA